MASRRARPFRCQHSPRAPLQRASDPRGPLTIAPARADGRGAACAGRQGRPCRAAPSRRRPIASPPGAAAARARCRGRCTPSSAGPPRAGTPRPFARRARRMPCPLAEQHEHPAEPSLAFRDPSWEDLADPGLARFCPIGGAHAGVQSLPASVARGGTRGKGHSAGSRARVVRHGREPDDQRQCRPAAVARAGRGTG